MILETLSLVDIIIIFLVILSISIYTLKRDVPHNLPPGPRGWPVTGSLFTLGKAENLSLTLKDMAREYGEVMSLKLGSKRAIVLSGYDTIKEAFVDKAEYFSDRPFHPVNVSEKRDKGILNTSDWKDRRRASLTGMRDFGLGRKSLDERMEEEAGLLIQELEKSDGKAFYLHNLMPVVTTNIICTILRGERFAYDSDTMKTIVEVLQTIIVTLDIHRTDNYLPWLRYIPLVNRNAWMTKFMKLFRRFSAIIKGWVKEHYESFDEDNIRDLIDLFISESKKEGSRIQEENIEPLILDLFVAGTETTSTTLLWTIGYLTSHRDIQDKCRKEIEEVVGKSRIPMYTDSKKMPYINAVINEVQRMGNILPLSLQHAASATVEFRGYTIPKGTIIIANLESALKDEKYYRDPYSFRPERWTDSEGNLKKNPAQIPFSIGKRECLGMLLAKKELFVFLCAMLQNFEFELDEKSKEPNFCKGTGVIRTAPDYMVKLKKL